jgi:hypothetical protein
MAWQHREIDERRPVRQHLATYGGLVHELHPASDPYGLLQSVPYRRINWLPLCERSTLGNGVRFMSEALFDSH